MTKAAKLKDFLSGSFIETSVERVLSATGAILPIVFETFQSSATGKRVDIRLEELPGFGMNVFSDGDGWLVLVPKGMALRLTALLRLLLPYYTDAEASPYYLNSPLDEFNEEMFWTPPSVAAIFEDYDSVEQLRRGLERTVFTRPLDPANYWCDIEGMVNIAILYVLMHEIAHITNGHFALREGIERNFALSDFNLSQDDAWRCLELDADQSGTWNFVFLLALEAVTPPFDDKAFTRLAMRAGFAVPALLGLWDHRKKTVGAFKKERYLPPTIRHRVFAEAASLAVAKLMPADHQRVWDALELDGWKRCVLAFHAVTFDLGTQDQPKEKLLWPLGSLVYGGLASNAVLSEIYSEEIDKLKRFRAWRKTLIL